MAEQQASHRQGLEITHLRGAQRAELIGQIFGFVIGMTAIGASVWLITAGHAVSGVIALLGAIGGLVAVFFKGKTDQSRDLQRKVQEVESTNPSRRQLELFNDENSDSLPSTQH
jgi:hypothetical protein